MKVSRVFLNKSVQKIKKEISLKTLEKQISELQKDLLNIEVSSIQAIYGIKIDKSSYKKYKLG